MDPMHSNCADPSVGVSESGPAETKRLWILHGHPQSQVYVNPELRSLTALVEYNAITFAQTTAYVYPISRETTSYELITWSRFHAITTLLAAQYGQILRTEILEAMVSQKQPTIALLGRGMTFEYYATQIALLKLNVRVLLLADGNPAPVIHGLLSRCGAVATVVDAKHAKFDPSGARKVLMLEKSLNSNDLQEQVTSDVLRSLRYEDGADPWERHTFVLHSSGSTGLPKPIIHTNRSLILNTKTYRMFYTFHIDNWFLLFPLYHIAGVFVILGGLPNGQLTSFCPRDWPPTASSILDAWKKLKSQGFPVDCVHCPPTIIENLHEHITKNGSDFSPLSCLKVLQPGGAKLSDSIVSNLVSRGVNVKSTYGSTEIGAVMRTIPHTRENPHCYEGFRVIYPDSDKIEMLDVGENFFEMIIHKGFELAAELWLEKADNEPYRTNDLFLQDPPGSGSFHLIGRRDDLLILSDGNNVSAGKLQLDIQASISAIKNLLAVGHTRPCVSLLLELENDEDNPKHELREDIWKEIDKINKENPRYSYILRSMIYVLPKGESLPVTPKGNVKRNETLRSFARIIDELYSNLKGDNTVRNTKTKEVRLSQIHDLVSVVSGIPSNELNSSESFYEIGMDSVAALQLRSLLGENVGYISLGAIFENPSVNKLFAYFRTEGNLPNGDPHLSFIKTVLDKYSSEFSSWTSSTSEVAPREDGEVILLTGASGSLGTALLERLVDTASVRKVYLLMRGLKPRKRLEDALNQRRMRADMILGNSKVKILNNYSMTNSLLGLDIDTYDKLSRDVTVIIHNAWMVDFNLAVEEFADEYLRGTMSLLRFCYVGRAKLFTYTSSVSTCLGATAKQEILETPIGTDPSVALKNGYAQSKYIVERMTQMACVQLEIRCKIFRIGQLSGHSTHGFWSENDMYPIMLATSKQIGAIPIFANSRVDWVPVDTAAGVITDLLVRIPGQDKGENYTVHNIVNPHPIQWSAFLSMIQDIIGSTVEKSLEKISMQEWTKRLTDLANASSISAKRLPALRLLNFFEAMASEKEVSRIFNTKKTERFSETLRTSPPIGKELMELYIRVWKQSGFWPDY